MWKNVVYQHWLKIWDDLRVQHTRPQKHPRTTFSVFCFSSTTWISGWTMMDQWENAGKSTQQNHGKTMGKPWENGKSMEHPWENPWKIHEKSIIFCDFHENPWENPWKIHEKSIIFMRTFPKPNDHYDRLPILVVDVPPLGFGQGGLAQHAPRVWRTDMIRRINVVIQKWWFNGEHTWQCVKTLYPWWTSK